MDSLITPFEEQNPDIKIDFQDIPNVNDAVRVQLGSGNGPDIFMADAFEIPEYVKSDLLLPLDKYVDQYKRGTSSTHGPCDRQRSMENSTRFQTSTKHRC